jgi:proline iminopeptidase
LFEQRGTGRSIPDRFDSTTINLRTATDDLVLLLKHLDLKQAMFAGHSWGAALAMNIAAIHPEKVRGLILIGPGGYRDWTGMFEILQTNIRGRLSRSQLGRLDTLGQLINTKRATPEQVNEHRKIFRSTYVYDRASYDSLSSKMDVPANAYMRMLMNNDVKKNLDLTQSLPRYKGPFHIIAGRQDVLAFNAYEIKILMPSVTLHWIDGCGHFPFFEKPEEFYPIFFKTLENSVSK